MAENAIPKKGKQNILIPLLILVTLMACGGAGYSFWRMQQYSTLTEKAVVEPPPAPVFFALDTFTVNLGDADRVLYIGITLRLKDEATRQRINEFLPEVRSRLLLLFSRQNAEQLATDQGKQKLVEEIKTAVAPPLMKGEPGQVVSDVLYNAFILR